MDSARIQRLLSGSDLDGVRRFWGVRWPGATV